MTGSSHVQRKKHANFQTEASVATRQLRSAELAALTESAMARRSWSAREPIAFTKTQPTFYITSMRSPVGNERILSDRDPGRPAPVEAFVEETIAGVT